MAQGIDPKKVAIYVRWSTDDQANGTTLDVQRDACEKYLSIQGWSFNSDLLFIDDGYSGGNLERPAMSALRRAVEKQEVECVVVYKLDRLSRSVVDTVRLVIEEWDGICHVKSAREAIDTASPAGRMFFYLLVSYAEWERSVIKDRTMSGKVKRASEGKNPGIRIPYGYYLSSPSVIAVDANKASVVRSIFKRYADGCGLAAIARQLNAEGITGIRGGVWATTSVQYIIGNHIYTGKFVYGRTQHNEQYKKGGNKPTRRVSDSPLAESRVPAIVDDELWSLCQTTRKERAKSVKVQGGRTLSSKYLLVGIAKCRCGHALRVRVGTNKRRTPYYFCPARYNKGTTFCNAGFIPQKVADVDVIQKMIRMGVSEIRGRYLQNRMRESKMAVDFAKSNLRDTEESLKALDGQEDRLTRDYLSGVLLADIYQSLRARVSDERKEKAAQLSTAKQNLDIVLKNSTGTNQKMVLIESLNAWSSLSPDEQKNLLRDLGVSIVLYREARSDGELLVDIEW